MVEYTHSTATHPPPTDTVDGVPKKLLSAYKYAASYIDNVDMH